MIVKQSNEYFKKSPERVKVQNILAGALKNGTIKRPDCCSVCGGDGIIDGHHEDYSKPLVVVWICRSCHIIYHRGVMLEENVFIINQVPIIHNDLINNLPGGENNDR